MTITSTGGSGVPSEELLSFTLKAKNYAEDSENKIHSADGAARYGFRGGLVPGIGVYAYMTRGLVDHFGAEWIRTGWAEARFVRPVYDGDDIRVRLLRAEAESVRAEVLDAAGGVCAYANAGMEGGPSTPIRVEDYPMHPPVRAEDRRPARIGHWPAGTPLGSLTLKLDLELAARTFVADVLDPLPVYRGPGAAAHPALMLAQANFIIRDNIALGPWIHAASRVRHFAIPAHGETVTLRGKISESFERRGNDYVVADLGLFGNDDRPLQHILHTAIIRLRETEMG